MTTKQSTFCQFRPVARRKWALALCLICVLGVSASEKKTTIMKFDAPGAGTSAGQGTFPTNITGQGAIIGYYVDANTAFHVFLRSRDGVIETIDAPGAGTSSGQGSIAYGLTTKGEIAGYYFDASSVTHSFLRARDGTFVTFDVAGGGTGAYQGTFTSALSADGEVAGLISDPNYASHGFLRAPGGAITTFDVPGAGTSQGQGTFPCAGNCLNSEGATAGYYADANNVNHGFLRDPDGALITFNAPGADTRNGGQGGLGLAPQAASSISKKSVFHK